MVMKKAKHCDTVEEVYACRKELDEDNRLICTSKELEQMGHEILGYTNRLTALLF